MMRDHCMLWSTNNEVKNTRIGQQFTAATPNAVPSLAKPGQQAQNPYKGPGPLTRLNIRPDPRLEKRNKCLLMTSCSGPTIDHVSSSPANPPNAAVEVSSPGDSTSRKRVLSSQEALQPPSKRLNKVPSATGETSSTMGTSVIKRAASRELATVEACNQVTLQQPRDVAVSCAATQAADSQLRVRKKKTRRGKKKNRKFRTKVFNADAPSQDVVNQGKHADVGHQSNHAVTVHNGGLSTVGDAHVVSLADHGSAINALGLQKLVNMANIGPLTNDVHQAYTPPTVIPNVTGVSSSPVNEFNGPKADCHKLKDLFVIIEKSNGVAYAVPRSADRILGRGGFGIVYKGFRLEGTTKTPVAIKVVEKTNIDCIVEDDELGFVPEEVAMLKQIKGHPNAIQLIDYISLFEYAVIVMERPANCKDLFDILAQQTCAMSEIQAHKLIKQLTGVLFAMEKKGMVHRDIKAENILVDLDNEQVKLIDFGLATTCTPGTPMKKFCGTPQNVPPEYLVNRQYEGRKESVWTLGLLFYYMVCGKEPFRNYYQTANRPLRIPSYISADLLAGMLRKNPSGRLTLEQVSQHPWMNTQTNGLCLPFGYRRNFTQKI